MKQVLCIALILLPPVVCSKQRLKRLEERVSRVETIHGLDVLSKSEDIADISDRLDVMETLFMRYNDSTGDLNGNDRNEKDDTKATEDRKEEDAVRALEQRMLAAFSQEKARARRQASETDNAIEEMKNEHARVLDALGSLTNKLDKIEYMLQRHIETSNKPSAEVIDKLNEVEQQCSQTDKPAAVVTNKLNKIEAILEEQIKTSGKPPAEVIDKLVKVEDLLEGHIHTSGNRSAVVLDTLDKVDEMLKEHVQLSKSEYRSYSSCLDIYNSGIDVSGSYVIYHGTPARRITVYCDMATDGGGWTVFQRRQDGSVDFYRDWASYARGFGDLDGEFWLGNELISSLTSGCCHELRVDLEDAHGNTAFAEYKGFQVESKQEKYRLKIGSYSGTAGDALGYHADQAFSTKDEDNVKNSWRSCAQRYTGAWWYKSCHRSNLNGRYLTPGDIAGDGVEWYHWENNWQSMKKTEMKFRQTIKV